MSRKELKSKAKCWLILGIMQLAWIVPIGIKEHMDNPKFSENTQQETVIESVVVPETEEVFIEDSTSDVVLMPEEAESETEVDIDTETETEVSTEVEFVSISFIPIEIQKLCFEIGEEYHIAPELLIAIIERESGGKVNAINKKSGCMGLMQLHPKYAEYYLEKAGASDPFDAEDNIRAGCEILEEKFETYYELPYVLMKYHGESDAKKKFKSGNYSKYCKEIMERMEEMQRLQEGENGN
jgi:hypothetical protein